MEFELQNLRKLDFCEQSELHLLKIEGQKPQKLDFCKQSEQRFWKIEVKNLWKLHFLRIASRASFVCKPTILKRHLAYEMNIILTRVEHYLYVRLDQSSLIICMNFEIGARSCPCLLTRTWSF